MHVWAGLNTFLHAVSFIYDHTFNLVQGFVSNTVIKVCMFIVNYLPHLHQNAITYITEGCFGFYVAGGI